MYAIIRAGGKQAKVSVGDVLDIELVKDAAESLSFTPLLVVGEDGAAVSSRQALAGATVTADVVGQTKGDKIDIFKYKNKTGYRRHQGHRQKYTQIKVTGITLAKAKKASGKPSKED